MRTLTLGDEIAFITSDDTTYFSIYKPHKNKSVTVSAVVQLIHGIYEQYPEKARGILRNRIFTNARMTEMCHGMIRVAAKRATGELYTTEEVLASLSSSFEEIFVEFKAIPVPRFDSSFLFPPSLGLSPEEFQAHFMQAALGLRDQVQQPSTPRYQSDRPIAALLVAEDNQLLAWATNTNSSNKTLHAEVNLIRNFQLKNGGKLPRNSKIYTTLKPCKMCAGMIWTAAEDIQNTVVYFAEDDPGPLAKFTVLNPGTHERIRATEDPLLRVLQLERLCGLGSNS